VKLIFLLVFLAACSSSTSKLTKQELSKSTRVIYGKIIDLNPDSLPSELQLTYVLSQQAKGELLSFADKFPNREPNSQFFWVTVPRDAKYFGINSIRFAIKDVEGVATVKDVKDHNPLFGVTLIEGTTPVYIGDIVIRSGLRKYGASLNAESFDLKEIAVKNNALPAKEFLTTNGFDPQELVVLPFNPGNGQQAAKAKPARTHSKL